MTAPRNPPLHVKIRVIVTRPMTVGTARLLLDRAMQTGIVPPGIRVEGIDWQKGDRAGAVATEVVQEALRRFYGAVVAAGHLRFAVVSPTQPRRRRVEEQVIKRTRDRAGRVYYRDARGRFVTREAWQAWQATHRQARLPAWRRIRRSVLEEYLDEGDEAELTATTRGGTPERR